VRRRAGDRLTWSRAFLHSGSTKGQFSRSLAELLFAHHRAAQSKLRRLGGRLGPDPMRGTMKSARLRLAARGTEWVAVMHGGVPQRGEPSPLRASARSRAPRGGCRRCHRSPTSRGGPTTMPRASTQPGLPDGFRRIAALLDGPGPRCLHYLAKADDRVIVRNSASVKIKHEEPNGG
jgi:hypothetical protein